MVRADLMLDIMGSSYSFHSAALTADMIQNLYDLALDDDGDGTNNYFDRAKGYDDRNIVAGSANDQHILRLDVNGRELYKVFDKDGNAFPNQFDRVGENRVVNSEVAPGLSPESGYYIFKTNFGTEIYLIDAVF